MQAMIDELAKQAEESLGQVSSKETLATFWQEYLSKNGKIPALMKNLRSVAPEERPAMGKIINELKAKVQAEYDAAADKVKQAELAARNAAEPVDITLRAEYIRPDGSRLPVESMYGPAGMDGLLAYMYTMIQECAAQSSKLDRAFLAPGQEKQRAVWIIISSLVDMARRLGIEILCEGVETEDQLQKLLASHCKYGQGYLFSPPMNLETFDAYVDAHDLERK